ncbi:hypothetical protein FY112_04060 [Rhizobium sp. PEPV16]|nr:hypothetical protein FY112_04060 [Rhizobium sp. PEPV16]
MRFTHIAQSSPTGCGIACLAMITSRSLDEAASALFDEAKPQDQRTQWSHMRRGLERLGVECRGRPKRVSSWDSIDGVALVAVSRVGEKWHWVLFDAFDGLIYDPMKSSPTPQKRSRRKLVSFLPLRIAR